MRKKNEKNKTDEFEYRCKAESTLQRCWDILTYKFCVLGDSIDDFSNRWMLLIFDEEKMSSTSSL